MPIYEYYCPNCESSFELKRPLADYDKVAVCPECNKETNKQITGFSCKTGSCLQASPTPFRKNK